MARDVISEQQLLKQQIKGGTTAKLRQIFCDEHSSGISQATSYQYQFYPIQTLRLAHNGPINTLKLNAAADRLISGGDDCKIAVWDLRAEKLELQPTWSAHVPEHGAISSCIWVSPRGGRSSFLIFGCVDGSIHIYQQLESGEYSFVSKTLSHNGAVEDLAFDDIHSRLASISDSRLLWNFGLQDHCNTTSGVHCLFSLLPGVGLIYDIDPWRLRGYYILPTRIGYATIGCSGRTLLVSNLVTGIDVYDLPPSDPIRMFRHTVRKNVSLFVTSVLRDSLAVAGSDDGMVRVLIQRTGLLVTTLHHGSIGTLVQIVDAVSFEKHDCVIASATSDEREAVFEIKIWSTKDPHTPTRTRLASTFISHFSQIKQSWSIPGQQLMMSEPFEPLPNVICMGNWRSTVPVSMKTRTHRQGYRLPAPTGEGAPTGLKDAGTRRVLSKA
ncbi:hypothetical protein NP233_g8757 [Leucocoprinus birnbaumii]|uniref:Uncharacterized protein n=1 Tax=Leucocoprinus birnbaumii TaxID=56174 RepID=A0AAD5YRJ3_9AGAR|nr:hypothetical protein NP233_g8757 [Leucocoprinus birnbaumii]